MSKNQHVVSDGKGGWNVQGAGNSRATKNFGLQSDAISAARQIAIGQKSEMLVHGRNGRIRERNTYGVDPHPPKG